MSLSIKQTIIGFAVAALTWGSVPIAQAATLTFFGEDAGLGETVPLTSHPNADTARDDFLSHLTGVGTEDFESFSDGDAAPLAISFPGAGNATLTGLSFGDVNTVQEVAAGHTNGFGRYPISGTHYFETATDLFAVEFDAPVAAFGFYGVDVGDFNGQIQLELLVGGTMTLTIPHTVSGPGGSVLYYGVIDAAQPFTRATFKNSGSGSDFFGFDDLTVGSVDQVQLSSQPEPGTLILLGTGLLGLVGYAWQRKPQTV